MFYYKRISQILTVSIVASMLLTNTSFASEPVECEHSFTYTSDGDNSHITTCELCGETYSEMCDMVEMDIPSCDGGENDAIYYHCELCGNTRTEEMIPMDGPVEEVVEDEPIDEESGIEDFTICDFGLTGIDDFSLKAKEIIGNDKCLVGCVKFTRYEATTPCVYPHTETFKYVFDESSFGIKGKTVKAFIWRQNREEEFAGNCDFIDYTKNGDMITVTIPNANTNFGNRDSFYLFFYTDYIPVERIEVDKTYRDEYFDNIDGLFLVKEQSVEQLPIKYYPENATIRRLTITGPDNGVHFSRDWGGTPVGSVHLQNGLIYVSQTTVATGCRETLTLTSYDNPKTSDTCTIKSSPTGKFIPIKNTTQMFY